MQPMNNEFERGLGTQPSRVKSASGMKRFIKITCVVLVALVCMAGGGAYWLWVTEPAHWQEWQEFVDSHSEEELAAMADALEQQLAEMVPNPSSNSGPARKKIGRQGLNDHPVEPDRLAEFNTPSPDRGDEELEIIIDDGSPRLPKNDDEAELDAVDLLPPGLIARSDTFAMRESGDGDNGNNGGDSSIDQTADSGPRILELTMNEVNAWMDQRLDNYLRGQGKSLPSSIRQPMLATDGDNLLLTFRYQTSSVSQVVTMEFDVQMTPSGKAKVTLERLQGGSLPLPKDPITNQLKGMDAKIVRMASAFDGSSFDPVVPLDQDTLRLLNVDLDPNMVSLTVQSE